MNKLGKIFRIHRQNNKEVLKNISRDTGITIKRLSKFENGKVKLDENSLILMYKSLNMEFLRLNEDMRHFNEEFFVFFNAIINYEEFHEHFNSLKKLKKQIETSEVYPQFILAELIYNLYIKNMLFNYKQIIVLLENLLEYLDDKQKQIFYDTVGLYYKNIKDYGNALKYYKCALAYGDNPISGLVNYHMANLLCKMGCFTRSLEFINKSRIIFSNLINIRYLLLNECTLGVIYTGLGLYNEAEQSYKNCLLHITFYDMKKEKIFIYKALAWTYILSANYEDAIIYANKLLELDKDELMAYFYKSIAYFCQAKSKEAKELICYAKSKISNIYTSTYVKAIIIATYTLLFDKPLHMKEKKLIILINEARKLTDIQSEILSRTILTDLYLQEKEYEKAFYNQLEITRLYIQKN